MPQQVECDSWRCSRTRTCRRYSREGDEGWVNRRRKRKGDSPTLFNRNTRKDSVFNSSLLAKHDREHCKRIKIRRSTRCSEGGSMRIGESKTHRIKPYGSWTHRLEEDNETRKSHVCI